MIIYGGTRIYGKVTHPSRQSEADPENVDRGGGGGGAQQTGG